jgi:transposase-like protein
VSYETIRCRCAKFGPEIARDLRKLPPAPARKCHLDEMFVSVGDKPLYLRRAVDADGEVLDILVQAKRDTAAALS